MDFLIFLLKTGAFSLVVLLFVCAASSIIIDQYFDRKEQSIKCIVNNLSEGINAGLKSMESLIKH